MDDLMEQFKQAQIVREAQYSSDIQQLRAELAMVKALYEEERQKSKICQEELGNVRLQLTTALATQTMKADHLGQQNSDNVILIKELQQQNNLKQQQIDAIRQHFLDLQQQNQQLSLENKNLQAQLIKTKFDAEEAVKDVKEAVAGLQLLSGKNMDLTPVTDIIFQAKQRKQSPLDLALAKLASETKKRTIAEDRVKQLETQIENMQKILKKCTPDAGLATTAGNGVQLLYNQLNVYKETIEGLEAENTNLKSQLQKTSDIVRDQEQQIQKMNQKLSIYRQNIREVANLRKVVRQMIKDEID